MVINNRFDHKSSNDVEKVKVLVLIFTYTKDVVMLGIKPQDMTALSTDYVIKI